MTRLSLLFVCAAVQHTLFFVSKYVGQLFQKELTRPVIRCITVDEPVPERDDPGRIGDGPAKSRVSLDRLVQCLTDDLELALHS